MCESRRVLTLAVTKGERCDRQRVISDLSDPLGPKPARARHANAPRPVAKRWMVGQFDLTHHPPRHSRVYDCFGVKIANTAPCPSWQTANRPTFGMSAGGWRILPPSSPTFLAVPSQSVTAK
jgi:hypothetical protein